MRGLLDSHTVSGLHGVQCPLDWARVVCSRPSGVAAHLVTNVYHQENKGSVEIMRKDLNDARDLHGQAESAAAVWKASGVGLGSA